MNKLKPLNEQVIVVTGASSGIGLATARLAAERGAKVVLAARTRDALVQAVDEINQAAPGRASFVEADVGRHAEHERIAAHALDRHGRIDSWINNAGVFLFGKLEDSPESDMRQLFETNFWGVVHGSLVAIRHLKAGGALINVGSVESDRAFPLHGIYSASKHAVKGFTDALRVELRDDNSPISVTLVKPGAISTPLPQHARSYTGTEPNMPPPLYTPEEVARSILSAAERPAREVAVGGQSRLGSIASGLAPTMLDWISEKLLIGPQISDRPSDGGDNLYSGKSEAQAHGDHGGRVGRPSLYSAATRNPVATLAVAGGVAAGAFLLTRRRSEPMVLGGEDDGMREEEVRVSPPLEGV